MMRDLAPYEAADSGTLGAHTQQIAEAMRSAAPADALAHATAVKGQAIDTVVPPMLGTPPSPAPLILSSQPAFQALRR